jgi:hypothetical protein
MGWRVMALKQNPPEMIQECAKLGRPHTLPATTRVGHLAVQVAGLNAIEALVVGRLQGLEDGSL